MSKHKMRDAQIDAALTAHRLPVDTPSQLSDAFRAGWQAARAQPAEEVQPVATVVSYGFGTGMIELSWTAGKMPAFPIGTPLYTRPPAAEADRLDAERLDWLDQQDEKFGFEDVHEGTRWVVQGPFRTVRDAIDAALAASKEKKE